VQPEPGGERHEVVGGRLGIADDDAADRERDEVVHLGEPHLATELTLGERAVDPVADATLLDRDQSRRVVLQHRRDGRGRVEGLLVHHLERRVAEEHGPVARHHPDRLVAVGVQVEEVGDPGHAVGGAPAGEHDLDAGGPRPVHGGVHRWADLLVRRPDALDPFQQRAVDVERDQPWTPVAHRRITPATDAGVTR
jgi:hypothetical protein